MLILGFMNYVSSAVMSRYVLSTTSDIYVRKRCVLIGKNGL